MEALTPSRKGAVAEAEIATAAICLDVVVLRPMTDGGRYDLAFDLGDRILRVQCKWASLRGDVLNIRCVTSRHTPHGYIKTTYSVAEVDAIGAYSADLDRCYLIPIQQAAQAWPCSVFASLLPATTRARASGGQVGMSWLPRLPSTGSAARREVRPFQCGHAGRR
jgi:hypothetical protein